MIKFKRKIYVQFFVSIKFKYNKIIQIIYIYIYIYFIKYIINYKFKFFLFKKNDKKKILLKQTNSYYPTSKKRVANFLNLP